MRWYKDMKRSLSNKIMHQSRWYSSVTSKMWQSSYLPLWPIHILMNKPNRHRTSRQQFLTPPLKAECLDSVTVKLAAFLINSYIHIICFYILQAVSLPVTLKHWSSSSLSKSLQVQSRTLTHRQINEDKELFFLPVSAARDRANSQPEEGILANMNPSQADPHRLQSRCRVCGKNVWVAGEKLRVGVCK